MQREQWPYAQPVGRRAFSWGQNRIIAPTTEQIERRKQRIRFNRLAVTLPMALVSLLWLVAILVMIWLAVAGEWFAVDTRQAHFRQLFSGIADLFTMLLLVPMLLLCALPFVAAIGFVVYRRNKRRELPAEEPTIPILWRVENTVVTVRDTVARTMPKMAQPVLDAHGAAAYIRQMVHGLKRILRQEISGDDER